MFFDRWINDFFKWIGCAKLKSRNGLQSVGLQYKSVSRCWSLKLTVTAKKLTDFLDFLHVNYSSSLKIFPVSLHFHSR